MYERLLAATLGIKSDICPGVAKISEIIPTMLYQIVSTDDIERAVDERLGDIIGSSASVVERALKLML